MESSSFIVLLYIVCANGDIRLSGGGDDAEGRVEICYNATWGTVCDNMWGPINADVACGQLGFSSTGASQVIIIIFLLYIEKTNTT